jgi:adenylate kinase
MINYGAFMKRIEEKIGAVHAADEIEEISWWNEVVRELNEISAECARELQKESSAPQFLKPSGPQSYESMPHQPGC